MTPRSRHRIVLLLLLAAVGYEVSSAAAQIPNRIGQTVKQRISDRKLRSEDSLINRIGDRTDSVLEKGARPLDAMISRTMNGLDSIVVKSYRSVKGSEPQMERDLRQALREGRADLDLGFTKGAVSFSPDGEALLAALARVLRKSKDDFILEGRYAKGEVKTLARKRALAVMVRLSELEVNPSQLHLVPRAAAAPDRHLGVIPVR